MVTSKGETYATVYLSRCGATIPVTKELWDFLSQIIPQEKVQQIPKETLTKWKKCV